MVIGYFFRFGFVPFLFWFGSVWFGLVWFGLVWFGLVCLIGSSIDLENVIPLLRVLSTGEVYLEQPGLAIKEN